MRLRRSLLLVLLGCGSSAADSSPNAPEPSGGSSVTPPAPVSSAPLQGTVGGNPFVGKVGLAHYSPQTGVGEVLVYDTARTCADYTERREGWRVHVVVRWQARVSGEVSRLAEIDGRPIGTASTDLVRVLFVSTKEDETHNASSEEGRVEVLEAGTTKGSLGRIRVRATSNEGHQVEGEIPVELCTVYAER